METAILILAMASIAYVMWWLVRNDGVPAIRRQSGLLRMAPPPDEAEAEDLPGSAAEAAAAAADSGDTPPERRGIRATDDVRWRERHIRRGRRRR